MQQQEFSQRVASLDQMTITYTKNKNLQMTLMFFVIYW